MNVNVSTEDLVTGLRQIARDLQSPDGTANRWIVEAADRMTLLANLAAKHVKEMESANQRITRLEDAGERLWVKARSISVEDTYDRHGNEVTVHELNPETVVLDYDHGDGITAGNMVELLEALKDWRKAKEAKL